MEKENGEVLSADIQILVTGVHPALLRPPSSVEIGAEQTVKTYETGLGRKSGDVREGWPKLQKGDHDYENE